MGMDNVNQKIIDTQRVINYINSFLDNVRVEDIIQIRGEKRCVSKFGRSENI